MLKKKKRQTILNAFSLNTFIASQTFFDSGRYTKYSFSSLCLSICSALPAVPFFLSRLPKPQGLVQMLQWSIPRPTPQGFVFIFLITLTALMYLCPAPGTSTSSRAGARSPVFPHLAWKLARSWRSIDVCWWVKESASCRCSLGVRQCAKGFTCVSHSFSQPSEAAFSDKEDETYGEVKWLTQGHAASQWHSVKDTYLWGVPISRRDKLSCLFTTTWRTKEMNLLQIGQSRHRSFLPEEGVASVQPS